MKRTAQERETELADLPEVEQTRGGDEEVRGGNDATTQAKMHKMIV